MVDHRNKRRRKRTLTHSREDSKQFSLSHAKRIFSGVLSAKSPAFVFVFFFFLSLTHLTDSADCGLGSANPPRLRQRRAGTNGLKSPVS